jgi:hypothetical protein
MTTNAPVPNRGKGVLYAYLERNRGKFTDEALTEAVLKEGYSQEEVTAAFAELARAEGAKPVRARARQIVLAAYAITFAVLVFGMLTSSYAMGSGFIGSIILAVTMGLALGISLLVVRRSKGHGFASGPMVLTGMLVVPVILLVIVAGLCLATGLPFHPAEI